MNSPTEMNSVVGGDSQIWSQRPKYQRGSVLVVAFAGGVPASLLSAHAQTHPPFTICVAYGRICEGGRVFSRKGQRRTEWQDFRLRIRQKLLSGIRSCRRR